METIIYEVIQFLTIQPLTYYYNPKKRKTEASVGICCLALQLDKSFWYIDELNSNKLNVTTTILEHPIIHKNIPDNVPPILFEKYIEVLKAKLSYLSHNPSWFECRFVRIEVIEIPEFGDETTKALVSQRYAILYHNKFYFLNCSKELEEICGKVTILEKYEIEEIPNGCAFLLESFNFLLNEIETQKLELERQKIFLQHQNY